MGSTALIPGVPAGRLVPLGRVVLGIHARNDSASVSSILTQVWRLRSAPGVKPAEAFFVHCDRRTLSLSELDAGRLVCELRVAPVRPAESMVVRIRLRTGRGEA